MKIIKREFLHSKSIKSVGLIGISNIIFQGLAFITSIMVAWVLTKEEYGYVRYIVQMGNFVVMFIAAGYSGALTRFIAAHKEEANKYFTTVLIIVCVSLFAVGALFLVLNIDMFIYLVIVGYSIPLIYYGIIRGFIDYKKMAAYNILRAVLKIILIFPMLIFIWLRTPIYVLIIYSFGGWIAIFFVEIVKRTEIHFALKEISKNTFLKLTRFSVFSVLSNVFFSSIITFEIFILKTNYGYDVVAEYSMAITMAMIYYFVPNAVNALLMPKVARGFSNETEQLFKQALFINMTYTLLIYLIFIFYGKWGIDVILGEKYIRSYYFLLILSIGYIFGSVGQAFGAFWSGINKPEYNTIAFCFAASSNILLSIYFTSIIGEFGVAYAYVFSYILLVLIDMYIFKYKIYKKSTISKI